MKNQELAKIFNEMADYIEMDDIFFKSNAYRKVAVVLETLEQKIEDIYQAGGLKGLENIPGVGKSIALKIEEYIKTGRVKTYEKLKKKTPIKLEEIIAVEGLGVRKAKFLYQKLAVKNLNDLEKKAKAHKIAGLEGFGDKTEKNILQGIAFVRKSKGRFLLGEVIPLVEDILEKLKGLKEIEKISAAGSVRRMKETIGDIDILAVSNKPKQVMLFFVSLPEVVKIWSQGATRSSVRTKKGIDIDLRVVPAKSYGSALQYFTGSKEHNIMTRRLAIDKGLKLNEYGVFKGSKMIAGRTEKEVYKAIGLSWIAPELRENNGEVIMAAENKLPQIIKQEDIRGDLHCHSNWNGGADSIKDIAERAMVLGYEYVGIADHTKFLKIEHGLAEDQLLKQKKEIGDLNLKLKIKNLKFKILWGCEANILMDGSVDVKDEVLRQMDFVIAGVHSGMKIEKNKMTQRIIKAMNNPHIDIIAHPTGRVLNYRDEYRVDFDRLLQEAKKTNTILEINGSPARLDLKDINIKKAKEAGVKMIINTDAHRLDQMGFMKFGVSQARRGWAEKKDIINTCSLLQLLSYFKRL